MSSAALPGAGANDEYVRFCQGVQVLAGLDLLQYKRAQMERRLRTLANRLGVPALSDYLALLRRDNDELERFLDRVTINVSQLWRNPEQWDAIGRQAIPDLAADGRIRVWSAGCSYGAEVYTVAAVCLEAAKGARVTVKGTDIDRRVLERAAAGRFSTEDARDAPARSMHRWFEEQEAMWVAKPELREVVSFDRADLLTMEIPPAAYDLVMCRNVVIYFNEDVRDQLHRRLAESVRSGGYLVIGSTERITGPKELGLELAHPFIYRKT